MSAIHTLDFETYYDKDYSLRKKEMTTDKYVHDHRFKVQGVGIRYPDGRAVYYPDVEVEAALAAIDWSQVFLLCHNSFFDGYILSQRYGYAPKFYLDTLPMARALFGAQIRASLEKLAEHLEIGHKGRELEITKGVRVLTAAQQQVLGGYCLNDVELTWRAFNKMARRFNTTELKLMDLLTRMFTVPRLELDEDLLYQYKNELVAEKRMLLNRIGATKEVLMSNDQFAELLMGMGVDPPTKVSLKKSETEGKIVETWAFAKSDPGFKELLASEDDHIRWVCEARVGIKSNGDITRADRLLEIARACRRLPVMLNYSAAHTHRLGGGNKMNMQNLKRGGTLRRCVKVPKGMRLVVVDSAQIEARTNAWQSGQMDLVEQFRLKVDIYSDFASTAYGRPVNRKRKEIVNGVETFPDFEPGFVGKTCILLLGYQGGPPKLRSTLALGLGGPPVHLTLDRSGELVYTYRARYSHISGNWRVNGQAIEDIASGHVRDYKGFQTSKEGIHLPNGMVIRYPGMHWDSKWKAWVYFHKNKPTKIYGGKATENVDQALARIIVMEQMVEIGRELPVVLSSHDEVGVVVPENEADQALKWMVGVMSTPPAWAPDLPVFAEGGHAVNYGDAKR